MWVDEIDLMGVKSEREGGLSTAAAKAPPSGEMTCIWDWGGFARI
jgi:hypothetical protein